MQDLYTRLTELLGKSEDDQTFAHFLKEIDDSPDVSNREVVSTYWFRKTGLEIIALPDGEQMPKSVVSITFYFDVPSVREGSIEPYRGPLLAGIKPDDSFEQVKSKIDHTPIDYYAESVMKLRYDFADHFAYFEFHEPHGEGLTLVSLWAKLEKVFPSKEISETDFC